MPPMLRRVMPTRRTLAGKLARMTSTLASLRVSQGRMPINLRRLIGTVSRVLPMGTAVRTAASSLMQSRGREPFSPAPRAPRP
jgi:hypothetical protein